MDIKEKNNYTSHHPSMHLPHAIGKGGMCSLKVLTYLDSQGFFQPKPLKLAILAIIVHHGKSKISKPSELSQKKLLGDSTPPPTVAHLLIYLSTAQKNCYKQRLTTKLRHQSSLGDLQHLVHLTSFL